MKRHRLGLGQHYLTDPSVVEAILEAASIRPDETVVEIGTGRGVLTERLAKLGKSLTAYEIDRSNYDATSLLVSGSRTRLVLGDAFDHRPKFDVLVSSLPYSESQTFVEWLARADYDRAVVMLQSDFVEKLIAPPGSREYRAISVVSQSTSKIAMVSKVRRSSFEPQPRVDSVIVSFRPLRKMGGPELKRVKALFALRKRTLASAAKILGISIEDEELAKRRVYSLSPDDVRGLWRRDAR